MYITYRHKTVTLSAIAPLDYVEISTVLSFSGSSRSHTVEVTIEDDGLLEIDEAFIARLELENAEDVDRVMLQPNVTNIIILDDDSEHVNNSILLYIIRKLLLICIAAEIGFAPDNYFVTERVDGFANLTVELISGQLGRDVVVFLNTQSGSAESEYVYSMSAVVFKTFCVPNRWTGF